MTLRAASLALSVGLPVAAPLAPASRLELPGYPPSVPGHTLGIIATDEVPRLPPARAPLDAVAAPAPSRAALPQLQAAQPPAKPGPSEAERSFYDRVFNGGGKREGEPAGPEDAVDARPGSASAPAPEAPLQTLKADVPRLLTYLCATPTRWRSGAQLGEALARKVEAVAAAGGIPRRVPKGWFGSETVVEPLDQDLLAQLPAMARAIRKIARSDRQDYSDLFYSFNVLTDRAASRQAFAADIAWLYGTYRLGGA